jgi:hypothetical protein
MRILGLTKTIMIFSLLSITVMISLEDIMHALTQQGQTVSAAALFKTAVGNFPMRWRHVVAQALGWPTISRRLALALWFVLILTMGRLLLVKNPKQGSQRYSKIEHNSLGTIPNVASTTGTLSLQEIYKMGFDDATQTLEFGSSLPKDIDNYIIRSKISYSPSPVDNIPMDNRMDDPYIIDDVVPPRRKNFSSKLGYTTIAAFYSLFKVIKELGFHDGRLDFRLLMTNLKNMEPWRLGLLGLSLYKVVSVILF